MWCYVRMNCTRAEEVEKTQELLDRSDPWSTHEVSATFLRLKVRLIKNEWIETHSLLKLRIEVLLQWLQPNLYIKFSHPWIILNVFSTFHVSPERLSAALSKDFGSVSHHLTLTSDTLMHKLRFSLHSSICLQRQSFITITIPACWTSDWLIYAR